MNYIDPMMPFMFCCGENGYNISISKFDPKANQTDEKKKVSASSFYSYRIMIRKNNSNYLHYFRQLLNQYLVDMYAKIETELLNYIRYNKCKLCVENYIHLQNSINNDINPKDIGQLIVLPSSFTGGRNTSYRCTKGPRLL